MSVLSILIPTLVERRQQCQSLLKRLKQIAKDHPIEILTLEDNREKSTGAKRNELIDMAQGRFSAFIDDDDDVPDHYFDSIFKALKDNPDTDCIGFKGMMMSRSKQTRQVASRTSVFRHSKGLPYSQGKINGEYLRPPNHLNPMLTEYFREIRFPDLTFAEDYDFCLKLDKAGLIKNETFLDIVMYHYYYNPHKRI